MKKIVNESYEVPGELQAKLNSVLSEYNGMKYYEDMSDGNI